LLPSFKNYGFWWFYRITTASPPDIWSFTWKVKGCIPGSLLQKVVPVKSEFSWIEDLFDSTFFHARSKRKFYVHLQDQLLYGEMEEATGVSFGWPGWKECCKNSRLPAMNDVQCFSAQPGDTMLLKNIEKGVGLAIKLCWKKQITSLSDCLN
jgi:hypothetical protein